MDQLTLALAQMNSAWEDKEKNKAQCKKYVLGAVQRGANAIVFPEMTLTGFTMRAAKFGEAENTSETVAFFSALARAHRIAIVFGVIFLDADGRGKNMAVAVDQRGQLLSAYQKIHPFSFGGEHKTYAPGNTLGLFRLLKWSCALTVCYDLRFAGLFERIAEHRPEVIFVIANWADKRIEHWEALLRARALDTQAYVVGVNRFGTGGGVKYSGHSRVYGPDGSLLADAESKTGLCFVTLRKQPLVKWRKSFPSLRDKKPELYSHL